MRDVSGLKQMERQTQDSLEAVHGALESVVDRLATIESDIRDRIGQAVSAAVAPKPTSSQPEPPAPPSEPAAPAAPAPVAVVALRRVRRADPPSRSCVRPNRNPSIATRCSDIAAPESAPAAEKPPVLLGNPMSPVSSLSAPIDPTATPLRASPPPAGERRPIDPNLPPDHPLEPGVSRSRYPGSPAERIAASEAALGLTKPPVIADPGGKSNFIAAARRAAQAASEAPARSPARATEIAAPKPSIMRTMFPGLLRKHARSLIIAASVLAIVLGSINIVSHWLNDQPESAKNGQTATSPGDGADSMATEPATPRAAQQAKPATAATASERQSALVPMPNFPPPGSLLTSSPGALVATTGTVASESAPAATCKPQPPAPTPCRKASAVRCGLRPRKAIRLRNSRSVSVSPMAGASPRTSAPPRRGMSAPPSRGSHPRSFASAGSTKKALA